MAELFLVGAQRSGTTYLYHMLDSHPQVLMAKPVRPEPKFFLDEEEYKKGKRHYETRYFADRTNDHIYIGEKSTSYLEYKIVAERIQGFYPGARILLILREPVARAYSNYRFSVENGLESLSFQDAIDMERERLLSGKYASSVNPYAYTKRGHYIDYIRDYMNVFDREQISIIIHEEFVSRLDQISKLFEWLGIDKGHVPENYEGKYNVSVRSDRDRQELEMAKNILGKEYSRSNTALEELLGRQIRAWKY